MPAPVRPPQQDSQISMQHPYEPQHPGRQAPMGDLGRPGNFVRPPFQGPPINQTYGGPFERGRGRGRGGVYRGDGGPGGFHAPSGEPPMHEDEMHSPGGYRGGYHRGGGGPPYPMNPMMNRGPPPFNNEPPGYSNTHGGPPPFLPDHAGPGPRRGGGGPGGPGGPHPMYNQGRGAFRGGHGPDMRPISGDARTPPMSPRDAHDPFLYDDANYSDDEDFRFERHRNINADKGLKITVKNDLATHRHHQQGREESARGGSGSLHTGPFRGGRREFNRFFHAPDARPDDEERWQHDMYPGHGPGHPRGGYPRRRGGGRGSARGGGAGHEAAPGEHQDNAPVTGGEGGENQSAEPGHRNEERRGRGNGRGGFFRGGRRGGRGRRGSGGGNRMRSSSEGAEAGEGIEENAEHNGGKHVTKEEHDPNTEQEAQGGMDEKQNRGRGRGRGRGRRGGRGGRGGRRGRRSGSAEGGRVRKGSDSNESEGGEAHAVEGSEHSDEEAQHTAAVVLPRDDVQVETEFADAYIDDEVGASGATATLLGQPETPQDPPKPEDASPEHQNKMSPDAIDANETFVSADENSGVEHSEEGVEPSGESGNAVPEGKSEGESAVVEGDGQAENSAEQSSENVPHEGEATGN